MQIKAITLSVLLFFFGQTNSFAQTYLGSGGTVCKDYLQIKKTTPEVGLGIDLWIAGYLSGLNFSNSIYSKIYQNSNQDVLKGANILEIISYIEGFCSSDDRKTINNAANDLWIKLKKR